MSGDEADGAREIPDGPPAAGSRLGVLALAAVPVLSAGWFLLSWLVAHNSVGNAIGEALGVALALLIVYSVIGAIRGRDRSPDADE